MSKSYSKTVGELLAAAQISFTDECRPDLRIDALSLDSRAVGSGTLFFALPGLTVDGRDFIKMADIQGATLVLAEAEGFSPEVGLTVPIIRVPGLRDKIGVIADAFFDHPSQQCQVFGVTGTNGKTSCCYLLAQVFTGLGLRSGVMGTLGYGPLDRLQPGQHTTPDAISVHRCLAEMRDTGITQVCMEVSSHALDQGRVAGVQFYATLFTNLSHDHLDYHGDMRTYGSVKKRLFSDFESELAIINAEDELGSELVDAAAADFVIAYGLGGDVWVEDVTAHENGLEFTVVGNGVEFELESPLVGLINVPNLLLVTATLLSLSVPLPEIHGLIKELQAPPGRMELFTAWNQPRVVVDYAHTPDALEKAVKSVREHCEGQLWCVFGCGGDRDQDKRPLMGKIAAMLADQVIITNDNPRSEDPKEIAAHISAGASGDVEVVLDRSRAIAQAIESAKPTDWVLIAGKGHESTQTIGAEILPFSDREQAKLALGLAA